MGRTKKQNPTDAFRQVQLNKLNRAYQMVRSIIEQEKQTRSSHGIITAPLEVMAMRLESMEHEIISCQYSCCYECGKVLMNNEAHLYTDTHCLCNKCGAGHKDAERKDAGWLKPKLGWGE